MFQRVIKNFSLDVRSLALFRVGAGLLLLIDFFFTRLPYFDLFYTNKGVLPVKSILGGSSFWSTTSSLHFISSWPVYQAFLFGLAIVCFFMLMVGYKTRWAVFGSWVLLVSFQSRNFLILNSGDTLFCLLLFWVLALPLGDRFSVDSALSNGPKATDVNVFSINSLAFIFQLLFVYYFTFLLKTHDIWKQGNAVYYALQLDNFRTVWGDILLGYPLLMKVGCFVTYYFIEGVLPLLFIILGHIFRLRVLFILLFCGFHLSIGLFLHLGLFSWICCVGWLALLPSEFWDLMHKKFVLRQKDIKVFYDGSCVFCKKMVLLIKEFLILPGVFIKPAQEDKAALKKMTDRNSWLVLDSQKKWHDKWPAFVLLVSSSPLLFYLAPLLRASYVKGLGNFLYQKVANNRSRLGGYLPGFQNSYLEHKEAGRWCLFKRGVCAVFFFFCFVYCIMWNVRTLNFEYYARFMPSYYNSIGAFFHLHQYWNMFAPKPLDTTGWLILSAEPAKPVIPVQNVIPVKTGIPNESSPLDPKQEGQVNPSHAEPVGNIDLWQGGRPVSMEKPYRYDTTFPVFRMRKMMENLVLDHKAYSKNYLKWLCRKWNKQNKGKQVKKIRFIYFKQRITPYGVPLPSPTKQVISKTHCSL